MGSDGDASGKIAQLAAPFEPAELGYRQDGKVTRKDDGKFIARFVVYAQVPHIRTRLDDVFPLAWSFRVPAESLTGEQRTFYVVKEGGGVEAAKLVAVHGSLVIRIEGHDVAREDYGQGKDFKVASTDAFKRCAARFGIGRELSRLPALWVEMDGDGKFAKPKQDMLPQVARLLERANGKAPAERASTATNGGTAAANVSGAVNRWRDDIRRRMENRVWSVDERQKVDVWLGKLHTEAELREKLAECSAETTRRAESGSFGRAALV